MHSKYVFHIGLHKTGTTFLQTNVFVFLTDIEYVRNKRDLRNFVCSSKSSVLYSDEGISGNLSGGNYFEEFQANTSYIAKNFPDSNILVGLRNPKDFILSAYKQYLHEGGTSNISDYFMTKWTEDDLLMSRYIDHLLNCNLNVFYYDISILSYSNLSRLNTLVEFVGSNKVLVQDDLKKVKNNKGVDSVLQVVVLIGFNYIEQLLQKLFGGSKWLSLYSPILVKLNLTPRYFAQTILSCIPSKKFRPVAFFNKYESTFKRLELDYIKLELVKNRIITRDCFEKNRLQKG